MVSQRAGSLPQPWEEAAPHSFSLSSQELGTTWVSGTSPRHVVATPQWADCWWWSLLQWHCWHDWLRMKVSWLSGRYGMDSPGVRLGTLRAGRKCLPVATKGAAPFVDSPVFGSHDTRQRHSKIMSHSSSLSSTVQLESVATCTRTST